MKLTQEQKRIKIAKACGWLDIYRGSRKGNRHPEGSLLWGTQDPDSINYERTYRVIPDYFNDLSAIIGAVLALPHEQQPYYMDNFTRKVMMKETGVSDFEKHNATAAQRADALGITLKLWEAGE